MLKKILLASIALSLLMALTQTYFPVSSLEGDFYVPMLLFVAEMLSLLVLVIYGTFKKSPYFSYTLGAMGLILVGALFKILHYPGADQLLALPFLIVPILYLPHFIAKPSKNLVDYMKLCSVVLFSLPAPLHALQIFSDPLKLILEDVFTVLLFATVIAFVAQDERKRRVAKSQ
jgi:hypothetical protein